MKHKLDRKSLEKLYIGFIRPILEYGGIVWDNCSKQESELLEGVQLEAARIITGLRKGTSHGKLYTELGWVPLKERRRINKLILLHKILHDETPEYLLNEIVLHANHHSSYNLRSNRVFEPPLCNTTSYKCSFFPNVIDSWNSLDVDTQNQHSRQMFKKQISYNICPSPLLCLGYKKI
jgi:hypothetical protein